MIARHIQSLLFIGSLAVCLHQWGQAGWIAAKANLAQGLIHRAWAATQAAPNTPHKPWPWSDTWPVAQLTWQSQRDPSQTKQQVVLANAQGESLAFGPSLHAQSSALVDAAWWVISGHRDTHFRHLQYMTVGDRLHLSAPAGAQQTFVVQRIRIENIHKAPLQVDENQSQLILVTCYPFVQFQQQSPLRYVVYATKAATDQLPEQTSAVSIAF